MYRLAAAAAAAAGAAAKVTVAQTQAQTHTKRRWGGGIGRIGQHGGGPKKRWCSGGSAARFVAAQWPNLMAILGAAPTGLARDARRSLGEFGPDFARISVLGNKSADHPLSLPRI